jgi:hypothetical protein
VRREEAEAIAEGLAEALQGDIGTRCDRVDERLHGVELPLIRSSFGSTRSSSGSSRSRPG